MPVIPFPRCPRCHDNVDVDALFKSGTTDRFGILRGGPHGMTCPHCGAKMRLHQVGIAVSLAMLYAFGAGLLIAYGDRVPIQEPQKKWVTVGAFVALMLLHVRYGRRFARFSELGDKETVSFPLEVRSDDALDPELVAELKEEAELSDWSEQQRLKASRGPASWRCGKCRQENPGTFEVCWECGAER